MEATEKFSYVKRGYNPDEVDKYIETLESVIKSYKEKDNAIKNAIVSAQMAADSIVENAYRQAEEIRKNSAYQLQNILDSVESQRSIVNEFQAEYNAMIQKYLTNYNENEISNLHSKINDFEDYLRRLSEIDDDQDDDQYED